jgi:hypothetical protein
MQAKAFLQSVTKYFRLKNGLGYSGRCESFYNAGGVVTQDRRLYPGVDFVNQNYILFKKG